jgi:hypothetical protein
MAGAVADRQFHDVPAFGSRPEHHLQRPAGSPVLKAQSDQIDPATRTAAIVRIL